MLRKARQRQPNRKTSLLHLHLMYCCISFLSRWCFCLLMDMSHKKVHNYTCMYMLCLCICTLHDLFIHEMLREKERQGNTTQQKDKAINTTQLAQGSYFSKKKLTRVGFEPTTIRLLDIALTNTCTIHIPVHDYVYVCRLFGANKQHVDIWNGTCTLP